MATPNGAPTSLASSIRRARALGNEEVVRRGGSEPFLPGLPMMALILPVAILMANG